FPGIRSMDSREDTEEERRLCYVAITRAKKNLYITNTKTRNMYGKTSYNPPSRFIGEIPEDFINKSASPSASVHTFFENMGIQYNIGGHENDKTQSFREQAQKRANVYRNTDAGIAGGLDFGKGDVVMHKKFGRGIIIDAQPVGNDVKLIVEFENTGAKHLMAAFAHLEKVD
ncbi:MAG: ATP-dependent DNA helicase PcrA, partial [Oscillospiraceae bacterium]|nr:ATP-dependent DNA helicase PcrA [Oscillospiraceae bacterium]